MLYRCPPRPPPLRESTDDETAFLEILLVPALFAIVSLSCKGSVDGASSAAGGMPGLTGTGGTPGVIGTGGRPGVAPPAGRLALAPPAARRASVQSSVQRQPHRHGGFERHNFARPGRFSRVRATVGNDLLAGRWRRLPSAAERYSSCRTAGRLSRLIRTATAIYVVDLPSRTVTQTIALQPGDEPGRLVEDGAGRVHVALRAGGVVATCDPRTGQVIARRPVCAAPRGLAYDAATDRIHVACHDGQLVSLPAAAGDPVRRLQLDEDLRDVVVDGDRLLVTRFRSAELLTVDTDGNVTGMAQLPSFTSPQAHGGSLYTPSVAWRTLPAPGGGILVLHQRGMVDPVVPAPGGYGGPNACDTIVHGCITRIDRDGTTRTGPALASLVLAIDMALSPDGTQVAVIAAGNATNTDAATPGTTTPALTRVFLTDLDDATDPKVGCSMDGKHAPCPKGRMFIGGLSSSGVAGTSGTRGGVGAGGTPGTGGTPFGAGGAAGLCCAPPGAGGPGGVVSAGGAGNAGSSDGRRGRGWRRPRHRGRHRPRRRDRNRRPCR